jgi:hypothetical protein
VHLFGVVGEGIVVAVDVGACVEWNLSAVAVSADFAFHLGHRVGAVCIPEAALVAKEDVIWGRAWGPVAHNSASGATARAARAVSSQPPSNGP